MFLGIVIHFFVCDVPIFVLEVYILWTIGLVVFIQGMCLHSGYGRGFGHSVGCRKGICTLRPTPRAILNDPAIVPQRLLLEGGPLGWQRPAVTGQRPPIASGRPSTAGQDGPSSRLTCCRMVGPPWPAVLRCCSGAMVSTRTGLGGCVQSSTVLGDAEFHKHQQQQPASATAFLKAGTLAAILLERNRSLKIKRSTRSLVQNGKESQ